MRFWNATTTTAVLYTICFLHIRAESMIKTQSQHLLYMIALVNGLVKYSNHHSSPIHSLFLTHESNSKPKIIGNICWPCLLCWMVLWNATTNTAVLYTICLLLMIAKAQNNIGSICWAWLLFVNGSVKYSNNHSIPLHNLFLTHESRSKPKPLPTLSGHDCSVEWFCEIQQPPQQSYTQSVFNSWEQKHT